MPVSGRVVDIYSIEGRFHSCNPGAAVSMVTPYSKNRRVVTVIDTDIPGGTRVGLVAVVYSLVTTAVLFPGPQPLIPDLAAGMAILWQPAMILFLQALWVLSFLYTGTSRVTFADIRFSVHRERI